MRTRPWSADQIVGMLQEHDAGAGTGELCRHGIIPSSTTTGASGAPAQRAWRGAAECACVIGGMST